MNKISSETAQAVLGQVGPALRALSDENVALKEKVAFYEKRERVEKLAASMEAKQLDPETTMADKVARLMESDNLDVVEEAVRLSAPQIKLAALSDHPGNPSSAEGAFVSAILGD